MTSVMLFISCLPFTPNDEYVFLSVPRMEVKFFVWDKTELNVYEAHITSHGVIVCDRIVPTAIEVPSTSKEKVKEFPPLDMESKEYLEKIKPRVSGPVPSGKPLSAGCINEPVTKREPVYEYRSGKLIPGYLTGNGTFDPEPDELIIDIKDYVYVPRGSRRIYNLPGKFVKKSEHAYEAAKVQEEEERRRMMRKKK